MRDTGTVKAFNDAKGYGPIGREHGMDVSAFSADLVPDAFPVLDVARGSSSTLSKGRKACAPATSSRSDGLRWPGLLLPGGSARAQSGNLRSGKQGG
jgi:cold shock CspA family protein